MLEIFTLVFKDPERIEVLEQGETQTFPPFFLRSILARLFFIFFLENFLDPEITHCGPDISPRPILFCQFFLHFLDNKLHNNGIFSLVEIGTFSKFSPVENYISGDLLKDFTCHLRFFVFVPCFSRARVAFCPLCLERGTGNSWFAAIDAGFRTINSSPQNRWAEPSGVRQQWGCPSRIRSTMCFG